MKDFKHAERVLHTRREETGSVIVDEALPAGDDEVWVLIDGHYAPILVSGHLLKRLAEQRVAISAYDWDLLLQIVDGCIDKSFTPTLNRQFMAGVIERAQRIE